RSKWGKRGGEGKALEEGTGQFRRTYELAENAERLGFRECAIGKNHFQSRKGQVFEDDAAAGRRGVERVDFGHAVVLGDELEDGHFGSVDVLPALIERYHF